MIKPFSIPIETKKAVLAFYLTYDPSYDHTLCGYMKYDGNSVADSSYNDSVDNNNYQLGLNLFVDLLFVTGPCQR